MANSQGQGKSAHPQKAQEDKDTEPLGNTENTKEGGNTEEDGDTHVERKRKEDSPEEGEDWEEAGEGEPLVDQSFFLCFISVLFHYYIQGLLNG